jgi:hypothetical protein
MIPCQTRIVAPPCLFLFRRAIIGEHAARNKSSS